MLNLRNIRFSINNRTIIKIDHFSIKKPGLYVFLGPSGCGKTTLLNLVAGLNTNYSGEMRVLNHNYQRMSEKEITKFRSSHVGVFFQHNIFLDDLTLEENISLTNVINTKKTVGLSKNRNEQIAKKLNIFNVIDQKIKTLSGGEKTRGSIARTLMREVPLYLFDEPTAALDPQNALKVMELIKEKSQKSIVILVTHDEELANKFADTIFTMKDGEINSIKKINYVANNQIIKPQHVNYQANTSFITQRLLKAKKIRNLVTGGSVNLGLVGLGLSFLLLSSVNTKLSNTFKGQFDEKTAYIKPNFQPQINVIKSPPQNEISKDIVADYQLGTLYLNNFDEIFPITNDLVLYKNNSRIILPSFHSALFNACLFLEEVKADLNPFIEDLEHDEIALTLPYDDFKILQNILGLPFRNNTIDLGRYLKDHEVNLILEVSNNNWDYFDEHSFRLKSVRLGQGAEVIMGKPHYVSKLFEEKMTLPSSLNLTKVEEYPWTLKKVHYLLAKEPEIILWNKEIYQKYIVFTAKRGYFSTIQDHDLLSKRLIVLENPPHFNSLLSSIYHKEDPLFYTFTNGLTFIEEMMMLGFQHNFFLAKDRELLEGVISIDQASNETNNGEFSYPDGIINLAIQFNGFGAFAYYQSKQKYALNEIGISSGLAMELYGHTEVTGESLLIGALISTESYGNVISRSYETTSLKIKEVNMNEEIAIYQDPLWTYLLFKDILGVNPLNLMINGAIYTEVDDRQIDDSFTLSYPYKTFKGLIDETLNDLEGYTLFIAAGAFMLSALIIFMVIYLLVFETSEQFSSLYLMGYTKETIHEIISMYIIRFVGSIIIMSLGQLLFFSFLIEFIMMNILQTGFTYTFVLRPYLIVVTFAVSLLIILLLFFKQRMKKIDLLQFSKKDL